MHPLRAVIEAIAVTDNERSIEMTFFADEGFGFVDKCPCHLIDNIRRAVYIREVDVFVMEVVEKSRTATAPSIVLRVVAAGTTDGDISMVVVGSFVLR